MGLQFSLTHKEAQGLGTAIVVSRVFSFVTIGGRDLGNSGWICVIAGMILVLPLALAVDLSPRQTNGMFRIPGYFVIGIIGLFEAAAVLGLITDTIRCAGMLRANSAWIAAISLAACIYIVCKNGSGIGNAAKIWLYAGILLAAVIFIAQAGKYRPGWLLPVLGPGAGTLAGGAISAAGYMAVSPVLHMFAEGDVRIRNGCTVTVVIAGAASAVICALNSMMTPVLTDTDMTRFRAIDMLVSNGREALALQLPILTAVNGGYIAAIAGYCFMAAMAFQRIYGKISGKVWAWTVAATVFGINASGIAGRKGVMTAGEWEFIAAAAAVVGISVGLKKNKAHGEAAP